MSKISIPVDDALKCLQMDPPICPNCSRDLSDVGAVTAYLEERSYCSASLETYNGKSHNVLVSYWDRKQIERDVFALACAGCGCTLMDLDYDDDPRFNVVTELSTEWFDR